MAKLEVPERYRKSSLLECGFNQISDVPQTVQRCYDVAMALKRYHPNLEKPDEHYECFFMLVSSVGLMP